MLLYTNEFLPPIVTNQLFQTVNMQRLSARASQLLLTLCALCICFDWLMSGFLFSNQLQIKHKYLRNECNMHALAVIPKRASKETDTLIHVLFCFLSLCLHFLRHTIRDYFRPFSPLFISNFCCSFSTLAHPKIYIIHEYVLHVLCSLNESQFFCVVIVFQIDSFCSLSVSFHFHFLRLRVCASLLNIAKTTSDTHVVWLRLELANWRFILWNFLCCWKSNAEQ